MPDTHLGYAQRRRRLIAYGQWQGHLIPSHDTQQHIKQLRADGMTTAAIARQAGFTEAGIRGILRTRTTRVSTAQAVLAVTFTGTGASNHVPSTGTLRRLQGLQHLGWSTTIIEATANLPKGTVKAVIHRRKPHVTPHTRDAIAAATRTLLMQKPPTTRWATSVRTRARAAGYLPMMMWDDIDDPTEQPDISPTRTRHAVDEELVARVWRLRGWGWTDQMIADEVGFRTASAVSKLRQRHPEPQED